MDPLQVSESLKIDESTTLSIRDGQLQVIDSRFARRKVVRKPCCCGVVTKRVPGSPHMGMHEILNAYVSNNHLTITYIDTRDSEEGCLNALQYPLSKGDELQATAWATHLLDCAYGSEKPFKKLKVLINPFCGSAKSNFHTHAAPIFAAAGCEVDVEETKYKSHACEIAEKIELKKYDAIVCCSGDGLPHEVFNGLARRPDAVNALASIAVAMIPSGSGNAMSWNLFDTDKPSLAALNIVKGSTVPLDLVSITQGDKHSVSFLSQSLGVVANADLMTDHLRWMGDHRFVYGLYASLVKQTAYPCEFAFKPPCSEGDSSERHEDPSADASSEIMGSSNGLHLKHGTVNDKLPEDWQIVSRDRLINFYTGNMSIVAKDTKFFPDALPNDGFLDVMMIDDTIGFASGLNAILKIPQGRYKEVDAVQMMKLSAYRLTPRDKDGCISVDGEQFPFEAMQVEVHRGLGRVLSKPNHVEVLK